MNRTTKCKLSRAKKLTKTIIAIIAAAMFSSLHGFAATEVNGIWYDFSETTAEVTYKTPFENTPTYTGDFVIPSAVNYNGKNYTVTNISYNAFRNCIGLTSLTIPESVTTIENVAFAGCENLASFIVESGNMNFSSENGLLFNKSKTTLIRCPETITGAFNIPEGVETIGDGAFYLCNGITSVFIPETVKRIENMAFSVCSSLTSIVIPPSVTSINHSAFVYSAGLREITLPFVGTSPTDNTTLFTSMFSGISTLKKVTITAPCTTIHNNAFSSSSLTEINLPNTITTIGDNAFQSCSALTSITIPESVKNIGIYAFSYCSGLTSIVIPESITDIKEGTFYGCNGLLSVDIPKNVTNIGRWAFAGCGGKMTSINVDSENPNYTSQDGVLFNKDKTILIQYPQGKAGAYTIPSSVTTIGNCSFLCCKALTSVTIPESVTTIEAQAFDDCSNLVSIDIPQSITKMESSGGFEKTKWYENQPDGVIYIGKVLCKYKGIMPALTTIDVLEGTTGIASSAFYNCKNLVSISLPGSLISIGGLAFSGCSNLYSLIIPNSVLSIGSQAFNNCSSLGSIVIPNKVTTIESWTFGNCTSLNQVIIPASVTSISDMAFNGCTGLYTIINCNPIPVDISYYYGMGVFDGFQSSCILYVPAGSKTAYENKEQWNKFTIMEMAQMEATTDESVVINGVAWATRNVDLPGTFAESAENAGKFYQWNKNIAWSLTDPLTASNGATTWDSNYSEGTEWKQENNPCPAGYRMPDFDEIQSLLDNQKVSTERAIKNGVIGVKFTDKFTGNSMFMPVAGIRSSDSKYTMETQSYYWSNVSFDEYSARTFYVNVGGYASYSASPHIYGYLLRPVVDEIVYGCTDKNAENYNKLATKNDGSCKYTQIIVPESVTINGVTWATRNVDVPGTFAENPESAGKFYQWNKKTAWNATDEYISGWDSSLSTGSVWEAANDPSPAGYRVPTPQEYRSLLDETKVSSTWTTQNGVTGTLFTDKATGETLFLPAASQRYSNDGKLYNGVFGYYWTNLSRTAQSVYTLYTSESMAAWDFTYESSNGQSVRSVKVVAPREVPENVTINGVTWATRNVDAPGTFAETPESEGKFYQWNRKTAWSTAGSYVSGWDSSMPAGDTWEKANDPSPAGYRVPTPQECASLFDESKVTNEWVIQNTVSGRLFTDKATGATLFFPAANKRYGDNGGNTSDIGTYGHYWSNSVSEYSEKAAYTLYFFKNLATWNYIYDFADGQSLRSVKDDAPTEILGCTDQTATNYNQLATKDDGSCTYTIDCLKNKPQPPVIGQPKDICEYEQPPVLFATGSTGSTITWYVAYDVLLATGNNFPTKEIMPGNYAYYATQTVNGCESEKATVTYSIKPRPIPPTVTSAESCYGMPNNALTTVGYAVNVLWYKNYMLQNAMSTNSFTPTDTSPGIYAYQATQTVNGCESEKATVTYRIKEMPKAPTLSISMSQICSYDSDPTIGAMLEPLMSAIDKTAKIRWYSAQNQAAQLPQFDGQLTITASRTISLQYFATQEVEGCVSAFANVYYQVVPPLAAPTASNAEMCVNATDIPVLYTTATNAKWYERETLLPYIPTELPIATGTSFRPPTGITKTSTYWVQNTFQGCLSPMTPVTLSVITDASCTPIPGCTDKEATNYNPLANQDDKSCIYPIKGCTNNSATNYNPLATKDDASCQYSVTVSVAASAGGTVSGGGVFTVNSTATVNAVAADGYRFVEWRENGAQVSTEAHYTFTVSGVRNLTCVFEIMNVLQINVTSIPAGAGLLDGDGSYFAGNTVLVSAAAKSGYTFVNWIENGEVISKDNIYSFTASNDRNLIAVFTERQTDISGVEVPAGEGIIVIPEAQGARIVWNDLSEATGYKLLITDSNGVLVCTLEFDANGQLVTLVYTPNALKSNEVFGIRLTNLAANTTYHYTMEILGNNNTLLETKSGTFTTGTSVGVETLPATSPQHNVIGYFTLLGQKLPQEPAHGVYIIMYDNGTSETRVRK